MQKSKREDRESIYDKTPERIIGCVIDSRVLMSVSDASAIRAKETELWNYDPQLTGRGVVDEKDQARPARCVSVFQAVSVLQVIVLVGSEGISVIMLLCFGLAVMGI
ncbi:hypothetical protein F2Q70_00037567 [Brassica cretica]|uniref:Uncharacterized protein n=1 Tax=Brassica cretica TaxID=69181 RepID=A0A8S9JUV1_BRACR|nr:hypothetical protein F2Q70_00037567 [Brassica cretica]